MRLYLLPLLVSRARLRITAMAQFLQVVHPDTWKIRSTRRQLLRYVEFFNEINQSLNTVGGLVENFLGQLEHLLPPS